MNLIKKEQCNENKSIKGALLRDSVLDAHKWNLSKLFMSDDAWETEFSRFELQINSISSYKGKLSESAKTFAACLNIDRQNSISAERLYSYAHLRTSEDGSNTKHEARLRRIQNAYSRYQTQKSFFIPELCQIDEALMEKFLKDELISEFSIMLKKILRYRSHILSEKEERLLSLQYEFSQTSEKSFSVLTDVEFNFGQVKTKEGKIPLTQSSFSSFLIHPDRKVRKIAYNRFYREFDRHKYTISNLYTGSVQKDIYDARVRNFESSLHVALFDENIPIKVYKNLTKTVYENLAPLHKYYELRRSVLNLKQIHLYDMKVPLVPDINMHHTYEEAVDLVISALWPLGEKYTSVLHDGLLGGWVDRYENKGKHSGAFSAGTYTGDPYILMNFKEDLINDVFTLAHEAGHSMHSWHSIRANPFQHYDYTIFNAEVASTVNEQLLFHHLIKQKQNKSFYAYLIQNQIDAIIATIYRQTMFAEFERIIHESGEQNKPITIDSLRTEYKKLLRLYFGPKVKLEDLSDLEGLRIPHFYNAFYVYKYATGLSSAITIANGLLKGGQKKQKEYIHFLSSGGSKYPLEQLKDVGIDLTTSEPITHALTHFSSLVDKLCTFFSFH